MEGLTCPTNHYQSEWKVIWQIYGILNTVARQCPGTEQRSEVARQCPGTENREMRLNAREQYQFCRIEIKKSHAQIVML